MPDATLTCLTLLGAWAVIGLVGLVRPGDVRLVARVLFPLGALVGAALALVALASASQPPSQLVLPLGLPDLPFHVRTRRVGSVFLFLLGAASAGVSIFAAGYFRSGEGTPPGLLCLQYHLFLASMGLVLLADDAYLFMVAWETMALTLVLPRHDSAPLAGDPACGFPLFADRARRRDRDPAVLRRAPGRQLAVHVRRDARGAARADVGRASRSCSRCSASARRPGSSRCTSGCPRRIRPRRRRSRR